MFAMPASCGQEYVIHAEHLLADSRAASAFLRLTLDDNLRGLNGAFLVARGIALKSAPSVVEANPWSGVYRKRDNNGRGEGGRRRTPHASPECFSGWVNGIRIDRGKQAVPG